MKVYLNKEYKCVKVEDNTFVANDSSNYIRYYFVTNANGDVIDKMDDTSVIYRNTEPSYVTVAFRRADGDVIQHLMASPKTDTTGKSFFEYEITNTDGVLYKKGALEISAQFIEATLSEAGGVKKVISQKVKAIAINTAHVLDNIGEEAEEYYSQYEQANNDAHAVLQAQITTNFNNIGTLQDLTTDAKDDLVKAINEVDAHADANKSEIGDLSTLTTDEKTTIVGAINEVDEHADTAQQTADDAIQKIGDLSALATDEKSTVVKAINEVDQHANNAVATANNAVATANEAKTTAQTAENNANSAVDKANTANTTANEAKAIAQGSQRAIGFATLQAAITALNGYSNTQLKVGDNVYIVETGVPDLWVAAVEQNSVAYNYTTNDAFNDDLVENTLVQVGYYKFAYLESDGKPCTVAWQNMTVAASDWVASTEFEDFAYEAKIILSDFVNFSSIPQVVFGLTEATSGNYAPICKAGDKGVYIYSKVNTSITLPTVVTFAPNVHGASMQGGGYTNKGKWVASTTYAIDDLVYTDNGQFVCIEGITSTTSPEQDTQHWQATFVANVPVTSVNGQTGAVTIEVPTKTSQLTNDSGFITANDIPTVPEALPQEASALKNGSLPTSGWITPEEGWKENTLPADRMWWSVVHGNGKFVAVARDSTNGAYSMDGITWTEMLMPASRDWKSVTYGNDKFVAVASGSANGAYSTDGINWTEMTLPASKSWQSVTYGDGKYVAVASDDSDKGAYSTDGITWTQMSMSKIQSWQSVTYGDGKFVAVAYNSKKGAYSTDGITWTEMTLTAGHNWRITYGNDKFVAVAVDWNDGAYSTDGITWTKMFMPESKFWSSVTYGDGKFVAVASDSNKVAYSTDGINWTGMSMPAGHNGVSVAYGDGKFVAVSSGANGTYWNVAAKQVTYVISDASVTANSDVLMELTDDGGVKASSLTNGSIEVVRDTVPTQPIPYTYKVKQTNASGQFTLVNHFVPSIPESPTSLPVTYKKASGSLPTSGWSTLDEGWKDSTMPVNRDWFGVTYGNGKFVVVVHNSAYGAYSTDGINWTETNLPVNASWQSVTYSNGKYVAVAQNNGHGAYSTDGINWTGFTMPARDWRSVTYGDGKYVAIAGNTEYGAYSLDGINWTEFTLPASYNWNSVTYGNGKFVVVTYNKNKGLYSTDGITWTETTMPASRYWQSVTYGDGKFVAVAQGANGAYSLDGINWTETTMPANRQWRGVTYGDGKYVAVADGNANKGAYSTDGINWAEFTMPANRNWANVTYGNGKFVAVAYGSAYGAYWKAAAQVTYSISDTDITANTSVKMYLTDAGGVKAQSKANGSITVIRDSVPTTAIPYEYEVEQTSVEGLFEVINAYVPDVPTKTSELTNDSGFAKTTETNTWTGVQTFSNADGIKTDRVHNLDNNDAWYNFDGANNRFGSPSRPTIIRTSEARPRAQVPSGETTVTKEIALLEDVPSAGAWVDVTGEATTLTQAGTYQFVTTAEKVQSIMYWDGTTSAVGIPAVALNVNNSSPEVITLTPVVDTAGRLIIHKETLIKENDAWVVKGSAISTGFKYRKIN